MKKDSTLAEFFLLFIVISSFTGCIVEEMFYYQGTSGLTGHKLKTKLHQIIKYHKVFPYTNSSTENIDVWKALSFTDEDPENPDNVILLYSGWSIPKNNKASKENANNNSFWNREHVWAKSHGGFSSRPGPGTDIHNIRASDKSINAKRANLDFDMGGEIYTDGDGVTDCKFDSDSWEPRGQVKGDIARMIFYMAVRYEGSEITDNGYDLELSNTKTVGKVSTHGILNTLLLWHMIDPVDELEDNRNERIYYLQGNRNPFIDRPNYAYKIWGMPSVVSDNYVIP